MGGDHHFKERLLAARKALGITQQQMSELLLTPFGTYEGWERGRFKTPGVAALAAEQLVRDAEKAKKDAVSGVIRSHLQREAVGPTTRAPTPRGKKK